MSAPATNAFSPSPVITIARIAWSCFNVSAARRSSSSVRELSAFRTLGRLMVTNATWPSRSTTRCSKGSVLMPISKYISWGSGVPEVPRFQNLRTSGTFLHPRNLRNRRWTEGSPDCRGDEDRQRSCRGADGVRDDVEHVGSAAGGEHLVHFVG